MLQARLGEFIRGKPPSWMSHLGCTLGVEGPWFPSVFVFKVELKGVVVSLNIPQNLFSCGQAESLLRSVVQIYFGAVGLVKLVLLLEILLSSLQQVIHLLQFLVSNFTHVFLKLLYRFHSLLFAVSFQIDKRVGRSPVQFLESSGHDLFLGYNSFLGPLYGVVRGQEDHLAFFGFQMVHLGYVRVFLGLFRLRV